MNADSIDRLKEIFKNETEELIEDAEQALSNLEKDPENEEPIDEIARIFNSITGSAGIVGFKEMALFTHSVENILDKIRHGELKISKNLFSLLLKSVDILKNFIDFHYDGPTPDKQKIKKIQSSLNHFKGLSDDTPFLFEKKENKTTTKINYFGIHLELHEDALLRFQDPLLLLRKLNNLGSFDSIRADISRIPRLQEIDPTKNYISYDLVLKTKRHLQEVKDIFKFVDDDNPKITIRDISSRFVDGIDTELADKRLGEILVDEGFLAKEKVEQIAASHKKIGEEIIEKTPLLDEQIEQVLDKKQKSRIIQLSSTLRVDIDRLEKLIDLIGEMVISASRIALVARETGLQELILRSDELDRISRDMQEQVMTMRMIPLDSIFKRFYRVVRDLANTLGKDIEFHTSGEETELDKTAIEQISESLRHMIQNSVEHSIETPAERKRAGKPGKGNIKLKAYRKDGKVIIILEDDGRGFDPRKIYQAVKPNMEFFKGKIEVKSIPGQGSKLKIKIPITIPIIDGMRLRIGARTYIIPLDAVVESFPLASLKLESSKDGKLQVRLRDQVYPFTKLHSFFGSAEAALDNHDKGFVVLVESTFKKFFIYVDEILGISRAVVKNLQKNYRPIPGIIGASLNGDGSISLIMDIPGIEKLMGV
ncbi:MAG: Histidine kinase [Acidobacteriota bacterium]|nr:Histidine kinase [Acidobacteriota bacterium]